MNLCCCESKSIIPSHYEYVKYILYMTHVFIKTLYYIHINSFEYNIMLLYMNESYILFILYNNNVKELLILLHNNKGLF